jgi:hypothetical protein
MGVMAAEVVIYTWWLMRIWRIYPHISTELYLRPAMGREAGRTRNMA